MPADPASAAATRKPRVFLSRTTSGLATLGAKVAAILEERGWEVIHQPAFNLEWRKIRHMLMEKIREADAVVCLVGPVHGFAPATPIPEFRDPETGREEFSCTQLEFLIARRLHKPLVTLLVPEALCTFLPEDDPGTPAQQALQADFIRDSIKKGEHVYHAFDSEAALLGAVRARLIEIPHPLLPPPAPENIPFPSIGTLFTGRDETLRALRESLIAANAAPGAVPDRPVVQLIHGTGGVGKTRLAVEYARRFPEGYTARLFLRGSSPGAIDESLASLAGLFLLNLPEQDEKETEVRAAAVIRWLAAHPGYLLVIDNVDTQEARDHAAALLAKLPPGHVLLTSRLHTWTGDILRTPLPVLSDTDAATLLLKYRSAPKAPAENADPSDALALARDLDGLALAILQAAAYLNAVAITIAEYHQRWKSNAELVRSWHDPARADYPASVATTWLTTFDQLAPASQALLNLLAWFAPDPIPRFLLKPLAEKKLDPDPLLGTDPYKALGELVNYHLAQPDTAGTAFSVHRLIQQVSADRQPSPPPALLAALAWINGEMPEVVSDVRFWPVAVPLTPHAVAAATFGADHGIPDPTARLLNQAAILLYTQANHRAAEPLMRRALAVWEARFGKDHPNLAIHLSNLAAFQQLADPEAASGRGIDAEWKKWLSYALATARAAYGSHDSLKQLQGRAEHFFLQGYLGRGVESYFGVRRNEAPSKVRFHVNEIHRFLEQALLDSETLGLEDVADYLKSHINSLSTEIVATDSELNAQKQLILKEDRAVAEISEKWNRVGVLASPFTGRNRLLDAAATAIATAYAARTQVERLETARFTLQELCASLQLVCTDLSTLKIWLTMNRKSRLEENTAGGADLQAATTPEKRAGTTEVPGGRIDHVHFSVTSPRCVIPGSSFMLDVWAHLQCQRQAVIKQAREAAAGEIVIQSKGPFQIARGTVLTAYLKVDGMVISDPQDTILWTGEIGNAKFLVIAPEDARAGSCSGAASIYLDGMQVAKIHFLLNVGTTASAEKGAFSFPLKC